MVLFFMIFLFFPPLLFIQQEGWVVYFVGNVPRGRRHCRPVASIATLQRTGGAFGVALDLERVWIRFIHVVVWYRYGCCVAAFGGRLVFDD